MGFLQNMFGGGEAHGKMGELLQTLINDLHLDQNQVAKFKEAFQAFRQQRKNIKDAGGDRSQIQHARTAMINQLTTFLNESQKQTFMANAAKYENILHQD